MFQHKNVCLWTPSLCPACFYSQIIAIPNLLHIKTIHSFKITEVIAKLWHVFSFKTIPDFVIKQPNVLCNHFVLCCVKIANNVVKLPSMHSELHLRFYFL